MVKKLALSLVHAARHLRPYFQNHNITIKTDYPIQKILQKPDLVGRMSSWAVELSEYNIRYEPHGPIKAQCLLDFVNDLHQTPTENQWTLHVDGSSNPKGVGAGIVFEGPNDILIEKSLHFAFKTSNNLENSGQPNVPNGPNDQENLSELDDSNEPVGPMTRTRQASPMTKTGQAGNKI